MEAGGGHRLGEPRSADGVGYVPASKNCKNGALELGVDHRTDAYMSTKHCTNDFGYGNTLRHRHILWVGKCGQSPDTYVQDGNHSCGSAGNSVGLSPQGLLP